MNAYLYQYIIATPILILHVVFVILGILAFTRTGKSIFRHLKKYGMVYALIAAIASVVGSLGFSELYAYAPCKWCWVQRIFHYPQVILFAIALKTKDTQVWLYSLWLAGIGLAISLWQIGTQFVPTLSEATVCSIIPAAPNCSDILIQAHGYITIPVMSATLFLALLILYTIQKKA